MKIFTPEQIRQWDANTIQHEPIASADLMERAAALLTRWLLQSGQAERHSCTYIFCGMGNNGGDGLAVARLLTEAGYGVKVFVARHAETFSPDAQVQFERLHKHLAVNEIYSKKDLPTPPADALVLDALLGTGLSRPATGLLADVIATLNAHTGPVIAIDIASGLFADRPNAPADAIVRPRHTVGFQVPKLAFFQPENAPFVGRWHLLNIGLQEDFYSKTPADFYCTFPDDLPALPPRGLFSHKGTFGHALLVAGSHGKMGAAVLAARACLRSGVGLLTLHVPACGYAVLQGTVPEAMCLTDENNTHQTAFSQQVAPYSAIGIGPGLGQHPDTAAFLRAFLSLENLPPLVLDADALNLLSQDPSLLGLVPENTILTPHPREFERLLGHGWGNDYEKLDALRAFCQKHRLVVVLKGRHTAVCSPEGKLFFNTTGNAGMATGGTGDVLTGILTALLAQGLGPLDAARLGVYRHGEAGDRAVSGRGMVGLTAGDLPEALRW